MEITLEDKTCLWHICVMVKTEILRARVDAGKKAKAEEVFSKLGISTGDAINIFLAQVVIQKGIPFSLTSRPHLDLSNATLPAIEARYKDRIPNQTTLAAFAEDLTHAKRFKSAKSLIKSLHD